MKLMSIRFTLLVLVVMVLAMPAYACDQCNKDGPVFGITVLDNDMVYQPVTATNKINMPSLHEVLYQTVPAFSLVATFTGLTKPVDQRARHVRPKSGKPVII